MIELPRKSVNWNLVIYASCDISFRQQHLERASSEPMKTSMLRQAMFFVKSLVEVNGLVGLTVLAPGRQEMLSYLELR